MQNHGFSLHELQEQFFSHVGSSMQLLALIDHLPATYVFVKDRAGCFLYVNRALRGVMGIEDESQLLGKTDYDFFTADVADRYRDQDQQVMTTGKALVDHVCVVPDAAGVLRWYMETKVPLSDKQGRQLGVAGIMHDLKKADATLAPYQRLSAAVSHISNHYAERLTVTELAKLVDLSISQFNRAFKQVFKISPAQYITRVRINAACTMLRSSADSVEVVAASTGFCDASHFVRQFKKTMQLTPRAYREQWKNSP
ncbi:MAG: AraC family transcriptional regulator [Planctomycetota bacterium]